MIHVIICGHNSHHRKPCDIYHSEGLSDYLLLLVKTEAWFYVDGKKLQVQPNMAVLYPPHTIIHYGCDLSGYNDDWIHFMPDNEKDLYFQGLKLPYKTPAYPKEFHQLSQYVSMMSDIYYGQSAYKEELLGQFMHILLLSLAEDLAHPAAVSAGGRYYADFLKLRTQVYNAPADKWVLQDMAAGMHLSVSYFQHLYKSFFGCSCRQDLILARLEMAKRYLTTTDMSIAAMAVFCGYENEVHFMRQFKKFIGITPTQYRNKFCCFSHPMSFS